jgi:hypothetical protein
VRLVNCLSPSNLRDGAQANSRAAPQRHGCEQARNFARAMRSAHTPSALSSLSETSSLVDPRKPVNKTSSRVVVSLNRRVWQSLMRLRRKSPRRLQPNCHENRQKRDKELAPHKNVLLCSWQRRNSLEKLRFSYFRGPFQTSPQEESPFFLSLILLSSESNGAERD